MGDVSRGYSRDYRVNKHGLYSHPYVTDADTETDKKDSKVPSRKQGKDLFYMNVSTLLNTLRDCAKKLGINAPEFDVAISDFRDVYHRQFCRQIEAEGLFHAAQSLL